MDKKSSRGIQRLIAYLFASLLIGLSVYFWNAENVTGKRMPMPFGVGIGVVGSGSMEPKLSKGDLIFVKAEKSYSVGDVVVFEEGGVLVVHEIVAIDGELVTTQGAANNTPDEPFSVKYVSGKVIFHIDGAGGVVNALKSPLGTVCLVGLAAALMLLSGGKEKDKEKDRDREKIEEIKREIEFLKTQKKD